MGLLEAHAADRRKKSARKRSCCTSKGGLALLCACMFLGYTAWRRSGEADLGGSSGGTQLGLFSRRDLKEQLGAGGQALFGSAEGVGITTFPPTPSSRRLLLATHNRLMWYYYETEQLTVLHEGQGVYYGGFPGERLGPDGVPTTVWVVSRPHNWRPTSSKEWLLELDASTGKELRREPLPSRFTHDTVRAGNRVYAANCGEGSVLELDFPSMRLLRTMQLFTEQEHVNTLAPTVDGRMWAMLHNLGPSILAEVDLSEGSVVRRLSHVGVKAHGAVQWRGSIIALDSDNAALIKIDTRTGTPPQQLWKALEPRRFLKALCVVDDIAFFGIAEAQPRQSRDSEDLNCELAAFDLITGLLLWRRQLQTRGLLNVVSAPHLQVESTAYAVDLQNPQHSYRDTQAYVFALRTANVMEGGLGKRGGNAWAARLLDPRRHPPQREQPESVHLQASLLDIELMPASDPLSKYPPLLDSVRWASGFPRLDLKSKDSEHGLASGAQLPLYRENVTVLRDYVLSMPAEAWQEEEQRKTNAWLAGRSSNLNEFKPGTSSIHLLFSDQSGDTVFEFPWWKYRFGRLINPILDRILGADKANVIRLQLALMPGGTHIKAHIDKGGYSSEGHRIHVVVASSPEVSFHVCEVETCVPLHVEEGLVFELNNRLRHYVHNDGETPRVHLVVDVAESPRTRTRLHAGQVCDYTNGRIVC